LFGNLMVWRCVLFAGPLVGLVYYVRCHVEIGLSLGRYFSCRFSKWPWW
jgi:hypothetical protein